MSRRSQRIQVKHSTNDEEHYKICKRKRKSEDPDEIQVDELRHYEVERRRQQFQIQNCWVPISQSSGFERSTLIPTPHREPTTPSEELDNGSKFRFQNLFPTPLSERGSPIPFPSLNWVEPDELWQLMVQREEVYVRDTQCLRRHPCLEARMRAILLDWLIEVCEVYRLHRETFYLTVDFVDRYLAAITDVPKGKLQLIGITALFIAAKLEEIYPPKLSDFTYVTDGACTDNEILAQELLLLKALKWDLSPITVNSWVTIYLQLSSSEEIVSSKHNFLLPKFSAVTLVHIAQLLDLCTLDLGSLQFNYSILAAAALYHITTKEVTLEATGLKWDDIVTCVQWMSAFAITIREIGLAELKAIGSIHPDDVHNIQTHANEFAVLERAQKRQEQMCNPARASPVHLPGILTPPHSSKKLELHQQTDTV